MAGALFARVKKWIGVEVIENKDLNAEFDNILNNLAVNKISGWSANASQMKLQTSPGTVGAESLPSSESGELERIRYQLAQIIGGTNFLWYEQPTTSLDALAKAVGSASISPNRINGGQKLSDVAGGSALPAFLLPDGTTNKVTLKASSSLPFTAYINNTLYEFVNDIVLTGLGTAPSTQNTAAINDITLVGQASSLLIGERATSLVIDQIGTNIQAVNPYIACFKLTHSAASEYLFGILSANGASGTLTQSYRGFFFDNGYNPISRIPSFDNDVLTIMKTAWIYLTTGGTLVASYNSPRYDGNTPTSATLGDYWYDLANQTWKVFNGSTWVVGNAILVGIAICDSTKCVGARSFELAIPFDGRSNIVLAQQDSNTVSNNKAVAEVSVYGSLFQFAHSRLAFVKPGNIEAGQTLVNSSLIYLYLTDKAQSIISNTAPYDRNEDLRGYYHPYQSWRCLGSCVLDSSGNFQLFEANGIQSYGEVSGSSVADNSIPYTKLLNRSVVDFDGVNTNLFADVGQVARSMGFQDTWSPGGSMYNPRQLVDKNSNPVQLQIKTSGRPLFVGFQQDPAYDWFSLSLPKPGLLISTSNYSDGIPLFFFTIGDIYSLGYGPDTSPSFFNTNYYMNGSVDCTTPLEGFFQIYLNVPATTYNISLIAQGHPHGTLGMYGYKLIAFEF